MIRRFLASVLRGQVHLHLASPEISIARVRHRVSRGGHSVPEDRIRKRFERNQPLIRDAAKAADYAYVFDNSAIGKRMLALAFAGAHTLYVADQVPDWTARIYHARNPAHVGASKLLG